MKEHTISLRKSNPGLKKSLLGIFFTMMLAGCNADRAAEPPFPGDAVEAALGQRPEAAQATLLRHFKGASVVPGGLRRLRIEGDRSIDGVILFSNVRTGRVDTVILKVRPDLSQEARRKMLSGIDPALGAALDGEQRVEGRWKGFRVEALGADRDNRTTVTVSIESSP